MTPFIAIFIFAVLLILAISLWLVKHLSVSTAEGYSYIGSTIYSIIAAVGLIATGIWVISTFNILNQRDIAQAQYEELKSKLENVRSSKIELSTEVTEYSGPENNPSLKSLIIKVKLVNVGNEAIEFDLSKSPLKIYEIEALGTKMGYSKLHTPVIYSELAKFGDDKVSNKPLSSFVSLISSERTLTYLAVLPKNKMYYVVFKTEAGDLSPEEGETDGVPQCDNQAQCKWFISKYLYLK